MNGRPDKYINIRHSVTVADLIPESGTCIRFKELEARCKEHGISHRILLKELKRLEGAGTIIKDAVKADRGAGTCYKRSLKLQIPFYKDVENAVKEVRSSEEEQRELIAAIYLKGFLTLIETVVYNELLEHARKNNKEIAERRLDSALNDFVLPMIKQITLLSDLPVASSKHVEVAVRGAIDKSTDWGGVWKKIAIEKQYEAEIETKKHQAIMEAISSGRLREAAKRLGKSDEEIDDFIKILSSVTK